MSRSIRLLTVAALAIVLTLSSTQTAFSSQWIIYDNDSPGGPLNEHFVGVRFSLPTGVSSAHVITVSFYWGHFAASIQGSGMLKSIHPLQTPVATVHITGSPPGTELITPIPISILVAGEWKTVSVLSSNLVVSGDFYVVIEQNIGATVGFDNAGSNFEGRSHYGVSLAGVTAHDCCGGDGSHNLMIRAEIDPITHGAPVGGLVEPVNTLRIAAPFLALFGIVATVAVVVVKPWKKRET